MIVFLHLHFLQLVVVGEEFEDSPVVRQVGFHVEDGIF